MTTRLLSVTLPVDDQDAALRFYVDQLGFAVRQDFEFAPGVRLVEVAPVGADVGIVLLPRDTPLPIAVRLETADADVAFTHMSSLGVELHNDEVLRLDGAPPMFYFSDPDGNGLVFMQGGPDDAGADGESTDDA